MVEVRGGAVVQALYDPMTKLAIQRAAGALTTGTPLRLAAQCADVSEQRLKFWMTQPTLEGAQLRQAEAEGKTGLHGVVYERAMRGDSWVQCGHCRTQVKECPNCQGELPERGDPKWAMVLLEKHQEYRQKIELGPLAKDYEAAAEMSEAEIVATMQRSFAYPDPLTERALRAAIEKPGPGLLAILNGWQRRQAQELKE